ncbi:MAG: hypothetical protein FWD28_04770 [Treponema sp.]|nr:hypothetical protein [Treponema sp.]
MRIAVVSAPAVRKEPPDYIVSLANGMSKMGHHVDIINAWTEDGMRLPGYEYIAVIAEPLSSLTGKIPVILQKVLGAGSTLVGKKSAAFIKKTGLFSNKALSNLMKVMENEGMKINWSDFLFNAPHAEAMGKRIGA